MKAVLLGSVSLNCAKRYLCYYQKMFKRSVSRHSSSHFCLIRCMLHATCRIMGQVLSLGQTLSLKNILQMQKENSCMIR